MTNSTKNRMEVLRGRAGATPTEAPRHLGVQSLTDVTGFGLIGQFREMALASKRSLRFFAGKIPIHGNAAIACIRAGHTPGASMLPRLRRVMVAIRKPQSAKGIKTSFDSAKAGGLLIFRFVRRCRQATSRHLTPQAFTQLKSEKYTRGQPRFT